MSKLLVGGNSVLRGVIQPPSSKSYTIRAIIASALSARKTRIYNPLLSGDTLAALEAVRHLGVKCRMSKQYLELCGRIEFSGKKAVNVGESGTLLRLLLPVLASRKGRFTINARGTLLKRSNRPIVQALISCGVRISARGEDFRVPLVIDSEGVLPGGRIEVSGSMSSQTVSALLNAAPLASRDTLIIVKDRLVSRPYVDITQDVLKWAGVRVTRQGYRRFFVKSGQKFEPKTDFIVHGDYSSAAFLIVASCLVESDVTIRDLVFDKQGDRRIIPILNKMGAKIRHTGGCVKIKGPFKLKGITIDCSDTPDLVPVLSVAACFAAGKTTIVNIRHLVYKESNRIKAPVEQLRKIGARIKPFEDGIIIEHSTLRPGRVSGCSDHRIAMALAVAGLRVGNLEIEGTECIAKSYPGFVSDMNSLGANMVAKR